MGEFDSDISALSSEIDCEIFIDLTADATFDLEAWNHCYENLFGRLSSGRAPEVSAATPVLGQTQENWQRAHQELRSRMNAVRLRKLVLWKKNRNIVANLRQQIDHWREMLRSAPPSGLESRAQDWIDEKLSQIREIQRFNADLRKQIGDIEAKLSW